VIRLLLIVLPLLASAGCGYKVSGQGDLLPSTIKTIAIPAWGNNTARYKLAERLPVALTREFLTRTRYKVVADPNQADAILTGSVGNIFAYPILVNQSTGLPAGIQMIVMLQMKLAERQTGKVLYERQAFEARQRYEISVDPVAYFEESTTAIDRLAREVSRSIVSSVLESF